MAVGVFQSLSVSGLGTCPTNDSGYQASASRGFEACFFPVLQVRTSSIMQQAVSRSIVRYSYGFPRANFGVDAISRPRSSAPRSTDNSAPRNTATSYPGSVPKKPLDLYTVGDFMTRVEDLYCASPTTTVDEAIEMLVEKRITGLPVVDDQGTLLGVVSDYDLLALDSISGKRKVEGSLFPAANSTWKAFKAIQVLLGKTHGKTVGELMKPDPIVVREDTNIEDAARILLDTKFRRLPVVTESGKLVGLFSRGNVVRAALIVKKLNGDDS